MLKTILSLRKAMRTGIPGLALLGFILLPGLSLAQTSLVFGKNIVAPRTPSGWYAGNTEHFQVQFYGKNKALAELTAHYAEDAFNELKHFIDYHSDQRYQIFTYNSPQAYFGAPANQYDNADISYHLNRFSLYYPGSQQEYYHQLKTKLAECMLSEMFFGSGIPASFQNRLLLYVPDWYLGGMSRFLGEGWGPTDEAYMRSLNKRSTSFADEVINSVSPNEYPILKKSIWYFVQSAYGRKKMSELAYMTRLTQSVQGGLEAVIGLSLATFTLKWVAFVQHEFPRGTQLDSTDFRLRLPPNTQVLATALSPDQKQLAFFSSTDAVTSLSTYDLETGKTEKLPFSFWRLNEDHASGRVPLPLAWSPDSRKLVFAGPKAGKLYLYYYDITTRNTERFGLGDKLDWITSLSWSPDEKKIVASASVGGKTDLYLFVPGQTSLLQLTKTPYDELAPVWDAASRNIFYTSNGGDSLGNSQPLNFQQSRAQTDVFELPFPSGKAEPLRLTFTPYATEWNLTTTRSKLYFLTDESGAPNLAVVRLDTNNAEVKYISNFANGIYHYELAPTARGELFLTMAPRNGRTVVSTLGEIDQSRSIYVPVTRTASITYQLYMKELVDRERKLEAAAKAIADAARRDSLKTDSNLTVNTVPADSSADSTRIKAQTKKKAVRFYVFDEKEDTTTTARMAKSSRLQRLYRRIPTGITAPPSFDINKVQLSKLSLPPFGLDLKSLHVDFGLDPYLRDFSRVSAKATLELTDPNLYHHITLSGTGFADLKTSDFNLDYQYTRYRVGGELGFSMQNRYYDSYGTDTTKGFDNVIRYNSLSFRGGIFYAINRFSRLTLEGEYLRIDRKYLTLINGENGLTTFATLITPRLRYSFDNTRRIDRYLIGGARVSLVAESPYSNDSRRWVYPSINLDARKYTRLVRDIVLATRLTAGTSGGSRARDYMLGGTDNWINQGFSHREQIPAFTTNVEDFYYNELIQQVRGYDYNTRNGSHYAAFNAEMRVPLHKLFSINLPARSLYNLQLIGFYDFGMGWTKGNPFSNNTLSPLPGVSNGTFTITVNSPQQAYIQSVGTGLRAIVLGFPVRADVAWPYTQNQFQNPQVVVAIGKDF